MKNNDVMDEEYGKQMGEQAPEPKKSWPKPEEAPLALRVIGFAIAAGVASTVVCLFIRLNSWILP